MLDAYYAARGWSVEGVPTAATAERLGLGPVVDDETPLGSVPAATPSEHDPGRDHSP